MNTGKDKGSQRAKKNSRPGKQAETVAPAQAASKQATPATPATPATQTTPAAETLSGFPIVGLGASAGGLAAFEAFFSGLPADIDPGMAFVLVQHLDPTHNSILVELVARYTRMPVSTVEDGTVVKPNCVYIIPPNHDLAIMNGALHLLAPSMPHGHRLPIDFFFRSLAQDQHENAIAIVLSGTGSDGAQGVREINGEGGMVMVQKPESSAFDGMPNSAINTDAANYVLEPAQMPAQLIAYVNQVLKQPHAPAPPLAVRDSQRELKKIFILIRSQTGHDFSLYKPGTIVRRIERRMALHQIEALGDYVKFLQQTPTEVQALLRDLLIRVTSFFRDPAAFVELESRLKARLLGLAEQADFRIWLPACSTGEEAYSIAILVHEHMEDLKLNHPVRIYATDIDVDAISIARAGLYPESIGANITEERLKRFFSYEHDAGFRVRRSIRDMITFSEQDAIKDPPFSKLDLISCRNLLIYLRPELQEKLIRLFHYALKPGGLLFLGNSEGVSDNDESFSVLDNKSKLFQRQDHAPRVLLGDIVPAAKIPTILATHPPPMTAIPVRLSLQEQTRQALEKLREPACALIESNGDILHLSGDTGLYLNPAPGDAGANNILTIAREGLRQDLSHALYTAVEQHGIVQRISLRVRTDGSFIPVNLTVSPVLADNLPKDQPTRYLVVFEEVPAFERQLVQPVQPGNLGQSADARITALQQELRVNEQLLRAAREDADTSTEELRSALEEMQSINEELQASNEELATVNVEQQNKVVELARALNDNRNLLAGSGIATVFVDLQQRILNFSPTIAAIINLIPQDLGRPMSDIVTNLLGYDNLTQDIDLVLKSLIPREITVQDKRNRWYLLRILPYRTLDNVIEGAAITFIDVSAQQQALAALEDSSLRYRSVVSSLSEGVMLQGPDGRVTTTNEAAGHILGRFSVQLLGTTGFDPAWLPIRENGTPFPIDALPGAEAQRTGLEQHNVVIGIHDRPHAAPMWLSVNAVPIKRAGTDLIQGVVTTFTDITERKQMADALKQASEDRRLAVVLRDASDAISLTAMDGRILAWNPASQRLYGWSEAEALGMTLLDRVPPAHRQQTLNELAAMSLAKKIEPYQSQRLAKDGAILDVSIAATALLDDAGNLYAIAATERLLKEDHHER